MSEKVEFKQAKDAAIILDYGGLTQAVVKGLNKLKPPGITNSVITVEQFRQAFAVQLLGGGSISTITYSGNYLTGDVLGQDVLKSHAYKKTKFTTARCYLNEEDFFMADLATDENSGFQVSKHEIGEADNNGVYSFSGEMIINGAVATFSIHHTSSTIAIAPTGGGDTLTDASANFTEMGIKEGDTVILENVAAVANNLKQVKVVSIKDDNKITFDCSEVLTAQVVGSDITIHVGRF
jgi:hypothetical protein